MKENSSSIYNISTMNKKSQRNLKSCQRKLNYLQQTRLSTIGQNRGIQKINPKKIKRHYFIKNKIKWKTSSVHLDHNKKKYKLFN